MKKLLILIIGATMMFACGCSHSKNASTTGNKSEKQAEIFKNFVVKYKIIDSTECSSGRGKGEFYISISEEYSTNNEAEVHDINPAKNEYRTSGKFVTSYVFSQYTKKKYTITLLDKNLFNTFVKKTGKFVGSFFRFPTELLDDYMNEYELCAKTTIPSEEIFSGEKKFYMKTSSGKTKVVIYASGE